MWCNSIPSRRTFINAALLGIAVFAAPVQAEPPAPRALTASAQALAIPSYFPLTAAGAASWTTMCKAAPAVGIALANVFNGPGTQGPNSVWTSRIGEAHAAGVLVLGYIYTGYADPLNPDFQTLAQAQAAVNNWYAWYPEIDGIFVDQTSPEPAKGQGPGAYYVQLSQHIRSKPGRHLVALNIGGDTPDATYMASGDIVVTFEGSYAAFTNWNAPAWTDGFDSSRFWHLVHSVPAAGITDAIQHSRINNGGWVFATPSSTNLWTDLPATTTWRTELETAQPLSRWRASNGATTLQYRVQYANTWTFRRVYIDTDRSTSTGYLHGGIGANFLIENDALYSYTGTGANWSWSLVRPITETRGGGGDGAVNSSRWDLNRSDLGGTTDTYLLFEVERSGGPLKTAAYKYEHVYTSTTTFGISRYFGENDSTRFYFEAVMMPMWSYRQIYLDVDSRSTTGYRISSIGADYLIENGNLYRYTGNGTTWSWALQGWIANPTRTGMTWSWWVWRADVKGPGNSGMFFNQAGARLIFAGNTGAPAVWSPVYVERFSP